MCLLYYNVEFIFLNLISHIMHYYFIFINLFKWIKLYISQKVGFNRNNRNRSKSNIWQWFDDYCLKIRNGVLVRKQNKNGKYIYNLQEIWRRSLFQSPMTPQESNKSIVQRSNLTWTKGIYQYITPEAYMISDLL